MCSCRKYPSVPTEGIFSKTPHPLEIPIKLHAFHLRPKNFKMFHLIEPPPHKKFQTLLQGEFVYFLDVYNLSFQLKSTIACKFTVYSIYRPANSHGFALSLTIFCHFSRSPDNARQGSQPHGFLGSRPVLF